MTAVSTDNELNMQNQTCTHPHTHLQDYTYKSIKLWFFLIRLWSQRYVCCYRFLVSHISLSSHLSSLLLFLIWADCLFDKCISYHPPPSSWFSFPLLYIAYLFFRFLRWASLTLPLSMSVWHGLTNLCCLFFILSHRNVNVISIIFLTFYHQKHKILHIILHKNSKVFCEEETTFTHLGVARDANWAKRNWRHGCERWEWKEAVKIRKEIDRQGSAWSVASAAAAWVHIQYNPADSPSLLSTCLSHRNLCNHFHTASTSLVTSLFSLLLWRWPQYPAALFVIQPRNNQAVFCHLQRRLFMSTVITAGM